MSKAVARHRLMQSRFKLAATKHRAGDLSEAERIYKSLLDQGFHIAAIYANFGSLLRSVGRLHESIQLLEKGRRLFPGALDVLFNLGNAFLARSGLAEAREIFERLTQLDPDNSMAWYSLGKCLQDTGDFLACRGPYRKSIELNPKHYESFLNLSLALMDGGEILDAIGMLKVACNIDATQSGAWNNLGLALQEIGEYEPSLESYKTAFSIEPSDRIASNILMTLQYHPRISERELVQTAKSFGARFQGKSQQISTHSDMKLARNNQCRIGFVSGDLFAHPVGFFLRPVVRQLKNFGVELAFYANGGRRDHLSLELQQLGMWREIERFRDEALAEQIRQDRIDILIDLSGHSSRNRLPLFALRPALKQFSWLGYFATTGMECFEGIVMDEWHVPTGSEQQFTEPVLKMPMNRFCYKAPDFAPDPCPYGDDREGWFHFACFNNTSKINADVIMLWSEILRAMPKSRLILKWRTLGDPKFVAALKQRFKDLGVRADQLVFRGQSTHRVLLAEYRDVDLALDPFPFSGGQTSCEALWMGVPVLTLPGARPVSRQSLSFLTQIDRTDWVAHDPNDYVQKALSIARSSASKGHDRGALRQKLAASPLCDDVQFAKDLFALLQR